MSELACRRALSLALLVATGLLGGCSKQTPALEAILARHQLNVATLNSPTTFYQGAHGPKGAEYQLAAAFAESLGVPLNIIPVADSAALKEALTSGRADIVAAGITPDAAWRRLGRQTSAYQEIAQLIVGPRGKPPLPNLAALSGRRLAVAKDSPQLRVIDEIRARGARRLTLNEVPRTEGEPLALVSAGQADYTVVDENAFRYAQHLYPEVTVALTLPEKRETRWIVNRDASDLIKRINAFLDELRNRNALVALLEAATPSSPEFELQLSQRLQRDLAEELPLLRPHFEEAARETGYDWRVLAALGYAESKWQAKAVSADGAVGVMMLLPQTANRLGLTARDDARANILAGARYFARMHDQIPDVIHEPDRTWFAMAAYNSGYGHVEDARVIAQRQGRDPNDWNQVRPALPLLAREEYYPMTKHGYARGWEPVALVDRVQTILKLLEWKGMEGVK